MIREESRYNVHLRKLNQPFEWHTPGPDVQDGGDDNNGTKIERKMLTCRNSVQGRHWIADDLGEDQKNLCMSFC